MNLYGNLAADLDRWLAKPRTGLVTIDQIEQYLSVGRPTATQVIQCHRRDFTTHARALLCVRGQRVAWYWLSQDPDEITYYSANVCRELVTRVGTQVAVVSRAPARTKAIRERQQRLVQLLNDAEVLSSV